MNPLLAAAAFGVFKGVLYGAPTEPHRRFGASIIAPIIEEAVYRAAPLLAFGAGYPRGLTAFTFATDHCMLEHKQQGLNGAALATRFADVAAGGLLYEAAYRQFGFFGAVLAHALHNVGCDVGAQHRLRWGR